MSTSYQDHVEKRVKEMRERERMFKSRRRKKQSI